MNITPHKLEIILQIRCSPQNVNEETFLSIGGPAQKKISEFHVKLCLFANFHKHVPVVSPSSMSPPSPQIIVCKRVVIPLTAAWSISG